MLTMVKLGGSLITDKHVEKRFRRDVMLRLADEIAFVLEQSPSTRILVGHGSGSFGHFAAQKANTVKGVKTKDEWLAFANVAMAASELNYLVCECLQSAGVPVWRFQPSASLLSSNGDVVSMSVDGIKTALDVGIVPVVFGDVSLDRVLGGTIISTEKLFFYLSSVLSVQKIFLLGEVDGVYASDGRVIPLISRDNFSHVAESIGGSSGVDVTGGMETKVSDMLKLVTSVMTIRIMSGVKPNLLRDTLLDTARPGTLIAKSGLQP